MVDPKHPNYAAQERAQGKRSMETYLGDGVYVYVETGGDLIWLYTSDGMRETNRIALEPEVLEAFYLWGQHVIGDTWGRDESP